ncbi:hypothetical protein ASE14_02975 [Agromyces sp. Root81]|uniref:ROK family protein n=1 Tax=Agromyces sp. Root81 TaxID=1736601 RepID=UPI0007019745|nr:ROK family protein [Agromyces sp. Root81]KRC62794.1 hypothetical protein ASE14_02975 [Agromyces sp. Root81]
MLEDEVDRARLLAAVGPAAADEPTLRAALSASDSREVADEVERQRRILATALGNVINVLNPSLVVLGGFRATIAERDLAAFELAVAAQALPHATEELSIRVASLGEDRLLIGAAEIVLADLLADPLRAAG